MSDRDYYEILGLTPNADGAMVDAAYWHLVRRYQAQAVSDPRARYLMDEVNEAYGVLGNPRLREQYDAFRDDVLIRRGMLKPVTSAQSKRIEPAAGAAPQKPRTWPTISLRYWRTYATSAVVAALAFAGAWQGVNPVFVITALAAGLAFSLTPALKLRLPDVSVTMPSVPAVALPDLRAPRATVSALGERLPGIAENVAREFGMATEKEQPVDAGELQASTAAMIARWRGSVGLQTRGSLRERFETPRDDVAPQPGHADAPIEAVMDILRGSRTPGAPASS